MKYSSILCCCFIVLVIFGCHKEKNSDYQSTGTITGPDYRMCPSPCCSGWFIIIESLTYEFDSLPASSNISLDKEAFPLNVKLDWQLLNTIDCPNKRITIQRIAKE
jgi:hypothetical protein